MNCYNAKLFLTVEKNVATDSYYAFTLCGYTLKGRNFWAKPQKDYLCENTIELVNVWFSYNQSNQYRSRDLSICDTCDKRQRELNKDRPLSLVRTILYLRSSPVGERCFAGAAVVSGQQSVRTFSTSKESCFVDKVLIWKSFT